MDNETLLLTTFEGEESEPLTFWSRVQSRNYKFWAWEVIVTFQQYLFNEMSTHSIRKIIHYNSYKASMGWVSWMIRNVLKGTEIASKELLGIAYTQLKQLFANTQTHSLWEPILNSMLMCISWLINISRYKQIFKSKKLHLPNIQIIHPN